MFNHVYGIVGIAGTLVTIVTSFLKDNDLARWILVSSGWIATLLVGILSYLVIRGLVKSNDAHSQVYKDICDSHARSLKEANSAHRETIKGLVTTNKELTTQVAALTTEKADLQTIASYIARTRPETTAIPRVKSEQDDPANPGA